MVWVRIKYDVGACRLGLFLGLLVGVLRGWLQFRAPPSPPPPPPLPPSPPPPPPQLARVAVCVGGWLELSIPRRAQSVRDHVLSVLPAEAFVAGTLRGNVTDARVAAALDGIGTLRPFARASVIPMPTPAQLRTELEASTHFREYEIQASKGGSGRFNWVDPAFNDPRRWIPIMMSPVLGNPHGNTLQELHYQSRCIRMVGEHERSAARGGRQYERVMFTRLEFEWLADHPPLEMLDPNFVWVPTGEDNTGLNDRHWIANRRDAEGIFRRWDALTNPPPRDIFKQIFFATSEVRPAFMSSETFMKLHVQYHKAGIARFPNVAMLQCCAANYASQRAKLPESQQRCFAKACHWAACPRPRVDSAACGAGGGERKLGFKYADEGHSAILHAAALALPGARLVKALDPWPTRLEISLPPAVGAAVRAKGRRADTRLYTCKTCETAEVVDEVSINVTGCVFKKHGGYVRPVRHAEVREAIAAGHECRYFEAAAMAQVCREAAPDREQRDREFGWFCGGVEKLGEGLMSRSRVEI